jgi:uncharacterized repeat protein (TIGR03803 family)
MARCWGTLKSDALFTSGYVFRLTPQGALGSSGGGSGTQPGGSLLFAQDGNLCGTTVSGGTFGLGTLFRVTTNLFNPVQTIYSFSGGTNGANPMYSLVQTSDGSLYGVTSSGSSSRPRLTAP